MAAAIGSSIRKTSREPACSALSLTARRSTSVMPDGMAMTTRGFDRLLAFAFLMKCLSMASVTSKSAMTPSLSGRMATISPGVLPSIRLASSPTAKTMLVPALTATTDGSRRTIPWSFTMTSVLAVPRSIPMSLANQRPKSLDNMDG